MPELAEVEYYRTQWNPGIGKAVLKVALHADKRIFRETNTAELMAKLPGARLLGSEAAGKQMVFRFSKNLWLGIHLGMTGTLRTAEARFIPGKHDHFVLFQRAGVLVFSDMRQFGRVRFAQSIEAPEWWADVPAAITSPQFTRERMNSFLQAHRRLAIKAALLLQRGFPGVGNWMADEILWKARIDPRLAAGELRPTQLKELWRATRFVCATAVKRIGKDFSEPPPQWLFHERWSGKGRCPRDKQPLKRETVGGRTTAWCPHCQRA
jgi:formamidopyrimidine-DNA glycosylase